MTIPRGPMPESTPAFEPVLLETLQVALGHDFADPKLLERALTHASYKNEARDTVRDNERLEFLGDAVLELIISDLLFREHPHLPEGRLTQLRSKIVNARTLSGLASNLYLGGLLRLGVGEERTGGRTRRSLLADSFEAVLGAVYLDGGFLVAQRVVARLYRGRLARLDEASPKDAKSLLQEWAQEHHRVTPKYRIVGQEGPDHASVFEAEVVIGQVVTARGTGPSKKEAQQSAAVAASHQVGLDVA